MRSGTIRWFDRTSGYGVIALGDGELLYVDRSALSAADEGALRPGTRVEFETADGPKGPQAREVRVLPGHDPAPLPEEVPAADSWLMEPVPESLVLTWLEEMQIEGARLASARGDDDEATSYAKAVLSVEPSNPRALELLSAIERQRDDVGLADADLTLRDRRGAKPKEGRTKRRVEQVAASLAFAIGEEFDGRVTVLTLKGDLTLAAGGDVLLKEKVQSLLQQGYKHFVLDLSNVGYVDSGGLGQLVQINVTVNKHGGSLKVANLTRKVQDLLALTKLAFIFDVFPSVTEALASFGPGKSQ